MQVLAHLVISPGFCTIFEIRLLKSCKQLSAEFHHSRPISAALIVESLPMSAPIKTKNMSGKQTNLLTISRSDGLCIFVTKVAWMIPPKS
jgi:hypothetical protein